MSKQYRHYDETHTNHFLIVTDHGDRLMFDDGVSVGECIVKNGKLQFFAPSGISESTDHEKRWKKLPAFKVKNHA